MSRNVRTVSRKALVFNRSSVGTAAELTARPRPLASADTQLSRVAPGPLRKTHPIDDYGTVALTVTVGNLPWLFQVAVAFWSGLELI